MYFIGIDIGTGSTKGVALDKEGKILCSSQVPYPTMNTIPGVSEQDPEIIWNAFTKCVHRITSSLTSKLEAICLSSAMHSVIPVNADGVPLRNMITWADNRSSDKATLLRNSSAGKSIYEHTGTPIHAMTPLCKIMWLRDSEPHLFRDDTRFISIKEFVWFRLFGKFEADYSIASATGLFNITTLDWHEEALACAGISKTNLSHPVNTNTIRKNANKEALQLLGITDDTAFMIGASDGCLANLGSFATEPGIAALTIGTSGAIRVGGTVPVVNWDQMTFNYRLSDKMIISGGPINNGGVALKWYAQAFLKKKLETREDYELLLRPIATIRPGADGLIFLPYLLGERAPIWDSEACGVFFGITAQHQQEHFTKAVVEGIVFSLYQIANGIQNNGLAIRQIHVSGGFVRSKLWVQLLADVFGLKVCLINNEDASAMGAAFMGMKTLGVIEDYGQLVKEEPESFDPDMDIHMIYRNYIFPLYEHLYKALALEMKIRHENIQVYQQSNQLSTK